MQHEITIPLCYLQAIRLFAPKNDIRFYLNGVAILRGHVVATNGHYIGAIRHMGDDTLPQIIIIPGSAIDFYVKKAGRSSVKDVSVQWGERKGVLTNGNASEYFEPIEGVFPQFERVLCSHAEASGNPQFQWHYVALFEKASEILGATRKQEFKAFVLPNGDEGCARVLLPDCPSFEGAIMPIRSKATAGMRERIAAEGLV